MYLGILKSNSQVYLYSVYLFPCMLHFAPVVDDFRGLLKEVYGGGSLHAFEENVFLKNIIYLCMAIFLACMAKIMFAS